MFEKIGGRLNKAFTAQPEDPDDNDFQDEFEPDGPKTLPHLYTVSDIQIEAVRRAMERHSPVAACAMQYALQLLGLPS
jgi:hypothetical protein